MDGIVESVVGLGDHLHLLEEIGGGFLRFQIHAPIHPALGVCGRIVYDPLFHRLSVPIAVEDDVAAVNPLDVVKEAFAGHLHRGRLPCIQALIPLVRRIEAFAVAGLGAAHRIRGVDIVLMPGGLVCLGVDDAGDQGTAAFRPVYGFIGYDEIPVHAVRIVLPSAYVIRQVGVLHAVGNSVLRVFVDMLGCAVHAHLLDHMRIAAVFCLYNGSVSHGRRPARQRTAADGDQRVALFIGGDGVSRKRVKADEGAVCFDHVAVLAVFLCDRVQFHELLELQANVDVAVDPFVLRRFPAGVCDANLLFYRRIRNLPVLRLGRIVFFHQTGFVEGPFGFGVAGFMLAVIMPSVRTAKRDRQHQNTGQGCRRLMASYILYLHALPPFSIFFIIFRRNGRISIQRRPRLRRFTLYEMLAGPSFGTSPFSGSFLPDAINTRNATKKPITNTAITPTNRMFDLT